jgi:hypothetical protein
MSLRASQFTAKQSKADCRVATLLAMTWSLTTSCMRQNRALIERKVVTQFVNVPSFAKASEGKPSSICLGVNELPPTQLLNRQYSCHLVLGPTPPQKSQRLMLGG